MVTPTAPYEEITTIFVVGFPDDMRERDFVNMFIFSNGFEAATLKVPPSDEYRKQTIGFAKFRTRQQALEARDVLSGRKVDGEKGSVLKAEMAKKNLHTKRSSNQSGMAPSVPVGIPATTPLADFPQTSVVTPSGSCGNTVINGARVNPSIAPSNSTGNLALSGMQRFKNPNQPVYDVLHPSVPSPPATARQRIITSGLPTPQCSLTMTPQETFPSLDSLATAVNGVDRNSPAAVVSSATPQNTTHAIGLGILEEEYRAFSSAGPASAGAHPGTAPSVAAGPSSAGPFATTTNGFHNAILTPTDASPVSAFPFSAAGTVAGKGGLSALHTHSLPVSYHQTSAGPLSSSSSNGHHVHHHHQHHVLSSATTPGHSSLYRMGSLTGNASPCTPNSCTRLPSTFGDNRRSLPSALSTPAACEEKLDEGFPRHLMGAVDWDEEPLSLQSDHFRPLIESAGVGTATTEDEDGKGEVGETSGYGHSGGGRTSKAGTAPKSKDAATPAESACTTTNAMTTATTASSSTAMTSSATHNTAATAINSGNMFPSTALPATAQSTRREDGYELGMNGLGSDHVAEIWGRPLVAVGLTGMSGRSNSVGLIANEEGRGCRGGGGTGGGLHQSRGALRDGDSKTTGSKRGQAIGAGSVSAATGGRPSFRSALSF